MSPWVQIPPLPPESSAARDCSDWEVGKNAVRLPCTQRGPRLCGGLRFRPKRSFETEKGATEPKIVPPAIWACPSEPEINHENASPATPRYRATTGARVPAQLETRKCKTSFAFTRRPKGMLYAEERGTRHRESLQAKDEAEARRLIAAEQPSGYPARLQSGNGERVSQGPQPAVLRAHMESRVR
jgi:hypothetical protein